MHKMLNRTGRTCISLLLQNTNFHAFYKTCGLQRDLMTCSSCLTLQRRQIFFLHISALCKSYKSFQCYCASCLQPHPTKISIDILLPGGCILSNPPCWPLHTYPFSLQCNFCIPESWSFDDWCLVTFLCDAT